MGLVFDDPHHLIIIIFKLGGVMIKDIAWYVYVIYTSVVLYGFLVRSAKEGCDINVRISKTLDSPPWMMMTKTRHL